MHHISLDSFLPSLRRFAEGRARALWGEIALIFFFCLFALVSIIGFIVGADAISAFSVAFCVTMLFLFYLLRIHVRENTIREALNLKRLIEERMEKEGSSSSEIAEMFTRVALSVKTYPPTLIHSPFRWLSVLGNKVLGYWGWTAFHTLGELLFLAAIDQYVRQIKAAPTHLGHHASLASCYIMLANHYQEPMKTRHLLPWPKIQLFRSKREDLLQKSRASSRCAIEELSILRSFAPDQLWVHDQLAISYRDLGLPEKEIESCEAIIALCPQDQQALMRLGVLYFQQGRNSKGLEIYERLKTIQPLLAEELIGHYGAYTPLLEST
jgi:tetratricopeptide (TPR) repeat protein